MIEAFLQITELGRATLTGGFLVFLRIGAAAAVLPVFGEQVVPLRVRLALAVALTTAFYPFVGQHLAEAISARPYIALAAVEIIAGLVFGIALRLFVHILQIAGSIAAQATSLSQLLGASATEPMPAIGHVLFLGGLALALVLGYHLKLVAYFAVSYELIPAGHLPSARSVAGWGVARVSRAFALSFSLAAPFVLASLIYNLTLGVINRAMPQLMVAFVGAPAITAGGIILLMLSAPLMISVWSEALFAFIDAPGAL